jgi:hypothetical protein
MHYIDTDGSSEAALFRALKADGLEMGERLGSGSFALCTTVKGMPFVAKITYDRSELEAVKRLKAYPTFLPGIIRIISYKEIQDPAHGWGLLTYAERLQKWEDWRYLAQNQVTVYNPVGKFPGKKVVTINEWDNRSGPFSFGALPAMNVKDHREALLALGCESFTDWKPANCLVRPGYGPVISDLGCTSWSPIPVTPEAVAPVKESVYAEPF